MNANMESSAWIAIVAMGILLMTASPTVAHHSRAMFVMAQNVTLRGVVKEYRWQNPHSQIIITVAADGTDPSKIGTWDVEASSVGIMVGEGWRRTTFKAGDPITVVVHPNRRKTAKLVLLFYAIKADGTRLYRAQHRYPLEKE